mmetsp:Transcript_35028/g.86974  ORF Transcript_35028/g.86974 Transcript_35028/m.86974 type:complete len:247 (-) Transcript_35028:669-1409(-)
MCFSLSVWVCAGCVCVCLFIQTDPLRPAERAKTVMCIKLSVFPRSLTTQQRDERSIRVDFHSSRVHPSIRPSLHPCVHPNSIGRSVCWSGECRFGFVEEWLERPLHLHVAHVHRTQLYPIQTHHEPRARLSELQLLLLLLFCPLLLALRLPLLLALRLPLLRLVLARRRLACIHGSSSSSSSSLSSAGLCLCPRVVSEVDEVALVDEAHAPLAKRRRRREQVLQDRFDATTQLRLELVEDQVRGDF